MIIALLVLTGFRTAVFRAVPRSLRVGISIGIGLFIAFVGLFDGGIVRKPAGTPPVELGINGSLIGWPMLVFVIGLFAVAILYAKRVKGAMLISIVGRHRGRGDHRADRRRRAPRSADNPSGWALNVPQFDRLRGAARPEPDRRRGRVRRLRIRRSRAASSCTCSCRWCCWSSRCCWPTSSTPWAPWSRSAPRATCSTSVGTRRTWASILMVDSLAAAAGGVGSVSSNTSYIESAAGVGEGARTGLASVVTGIGFLLAMFFAPLINIVPSEAATPALVFVGFLMMSQVTKVDWDDVEEGLPAFLTMALMPFTFSITIGIGAGFIIYVRAEARARQGSAGASADVGGRRRCSSSTSSRA